MSVAWDALENDFARLRLLQPRDGQFRDETIMGRRFRARPGGEALCFEMESLAPVSVRSGKRLSGSLFGEGARTLRGSMTR